MAGINAIDNIETRYQHFRETLTESAKQVLLEVERTARQNWMTAQILQKMEQRRLANGNVARLTCWTEKSDRTVEQQRKQYQQNNAK